MNLITQFHPASYYLFTFRHKYLSLSATWSTAPSASVLVV